MTAEEIYPLLENTDDMETLDQHLYDSESESGNEGEGGGSIPPPRQENDNGDGSTGRKKENDQGKDGGPASAQDDDSTGAAEKAPPAQKDENQAPPPSPLTQEEKETLSVQWQQRMAGAAQQAMQAGKFGGSLARMIDHLLQPQLPWRNILARYMSMLARDDFSYMRPSRREGEAIFPSLRSAQIDIVVAIDTSGSIKQPLKANELLQTSSDMDADYQLDDPAGHFHQAPRQRHAIAGLLDGPRIAGQFRQLAQSPTRDSVERLEEQQPLDDARQRLPPPSEHRRRIPACADGELHDCRDDDGKPVDRDRCLHGRTPDA